MSEKCHLAKQNSLSNWPANLIIVKVSVSIDDDSVGWEQGNQTTFWFYLCTAVTKVIGNRQIQAHFITHAVEIACAWTQLHSCDLSPSYDNDTTQLCIKWMLAKTMSSISNVCFFFCVLLNKEQCSRLCYGKWKQISRLNFLFILIWH